MMMPTLAGALGLSAPGSPAPGGKPVNWTAPQSFDTEASFSLVGASTVGAVDPGGGHYGRGLKYSRGFVFKAFNGTWHAGGNYHFWVFDVRNPAQPKAAAFIDSFTGFDFEPMTLDVQGNYAFVIGRSTLGVDNANDKSFAVVDISTPASPFIVAGATCTLAWAPYAIKCQANFCYIGFDNATGTATFRIVDISSPKHPVTRGGAGLNLPAHVNGVDVRDDLVYLTFENGAPNSIRIINVADKDNPQIVTTNQAVTSEPREIVVEGRYAYTGSWFETTGVVVIDVSTPTYPKSVGSISTPNPVVSVYAFGRYLAVGMQNSYGDDQTFRIYDVKDPLLPKLAAAFKFGSNIMSIDGAGAYLYVGGYHTQHCLYVIKVNGIDAPAVTAGNVRTGNLQVENEAVIEKGLRVGGGVRAGASGVQTEGPISAASIRFIETRLVGISTPTVKWVQETSASNGPVIATGTANAWDYRRIDGQPLTGD